MCFDCRRHCIHLDTHEEPLANVFAHAEVYLLRSVIVMCFCIEFAFSIQIEKETNEKSLSPDREPPSAFVFRLAADFNRNSLAERRSRRFYRRLPDWPVK